MTWALQAQRACEVLLDTLRLTLLWLLGTLAGGVLLGVGPATVAAQALVREELADGGTHPWRRFARHYREALGPGNALLLPVLGLVTVLLVDLRVAALAGGGPLTALPLAGLVLVLAGAVHLVPLHVHYRIGVRGALTRCAPVAVRMWPTTLLLLALLLLWTGLAFTVPVIGLLFGIGGWLRIDAAVCLQAYRSNDVPSPADG